MPGRRAAPTANRYDYLAGAGNAIVPLCNFGGCPAVAQSAGGDKIEIAGAGTFTVRPAAGVEGDGEYTWRDPAGQIVEDGTWNASQLLGFQSFGLGLLINGRQLEGGVARMRIDLSSGKSAVLRITCDEGNEPPAAREGINVAITGGPNFNIEVRGLTAFIIRP